MRHAEGGLTSFVNGCDTVWLLPTRSGCAHTPRVPVGRAPGTGPCADALPHSWAAPGGGPPDGGFVPALRLSGRGESMLTDLREQVSGMRSGWTCPVFRPRAHVRFSKQVTSEPTSSLFVSSPLFVYARGLSSALARPCFRCCNHRSSEAGLSVEFLPGSRPSTPISSSRSGQKIPYPAPLIWKWARSAAVP